MGSCIVSGVGEIGTTKIDELPDLGIFFVLTPPLLGFVLMVWAGSWDSVAALVTLSGSILMAYLSWWDTKHHGPATSVDDGFGKVVQGMCFCAGNYLVLWILLVSVMAISRYRESILPKPSEEPNEGLTVHR